MHIEQAIFTSAETERAVGYQLASRSPGISEADARELAVWGPAHDSLLEGKGEQASTNFHRLASGAFAISRTTTAGAEYSGRGGPRIYTQFLIVPADVLARFANNPFAVVRAATASGALQVLAEVPPALEPLRLSGRAPAVDGALLAQLACRPGSAAMAMLVQAALSSDQLGVAASTPTDTLLAGLINLLPVECRTDFSFSTGLKFSPSRPFRVSALPNDAASWRAIGRHGVTLLNLDGDESLQELTWEGWAGQVEEILKEGRISLFATQLERRRPTLSTANLPSLAEEMRTLFRPCVLERVGGTESPPPVAEAALEIDAEEVRSRADAPHARFASELADAPRDASRPNIDRMLETLAAQPAEVLEVLERIDDLVFAAISGDSSALAELQVLWPCVAGDLEPDVVEQSREQYLRCALSIWSQAVEAHVKQPERAISAIDVLCVLFDE
ncbi:MAG: hypothetical protein WD845_05535 [Pirellulales bacterium]